MRFVVFILGLFSCTLTGLSGAFLYFLTRDGAEKLVGQDLDQYADILRSGGMAQTVGFFLMVASALGLIGSFLVLFRCGWQGALLLVFPIAGPGVLVPLSFALTVWQAIPAFLGFFIRPLPITPMAPKDANDVEDEDED